MLSAITRHAPLNLFAFSENSASRFICTTPLPKAISRKRDIKHCFFEGESGYMSAPSCVCHAYLKETKDQNVKIYCTPLDGRFDNVIKVSDHVKNVVVNYFFKNPLPKVSGSLKVTEEKNLIK